MNEKKVEVDIFSQLFPSENLCLAEECQKLLSFLTSCFVLSGQAGPVSALLYLYGSHLLAEVQIQQPLSLFWIYFCSTLVVIYWHITHNHTFRLKPCDNSARFAILLVHGLPVAILLKSTLNHILFKGGTAPLTVFPTSTSAWQLAEAWAWRVFCEAAITENNFRAHKHRCACWGIPMCSSMSSQSHGAPAVGIITIS